MAQDKSKSFQKKIQETEGSGFGKYGESTGGGKVFAKGDSNTRTTRANGKERQDKNPSTNQPRTPGDGKFTYKSVNGQSIDPKYGPSRGKTVNPLLVSGRNGVMIDDVKEQFSAQSGSYWDKYKDKWYRKSGELITRDLKTRVAGDAIWDVAKRMYDKVKGEFVGESEVFAETKKGKKSLEEAKATAKAKESDTQQFVLKEDTGSIKEKEKQPYFKKKVEPQPIPQPLPKAPAPEQPKPKQFEGVKYDSDKVAKVLDFYKKTAEEKGVPEKFDAIKEKFAQMTPEKIDAQIDLLISKGTNFGF